MRPSRLVFPAFALLSAAFAAPFAVAACSKSGAEMGAAPGSPASASAVPPASAASAASASSSAAASAGAPGLPLSATPSAYMSIPERFQAESLNRPKGVIRAEEATAAFRKAGLKVEGEAQHLASTYKAHYCVGAKVKGDEITFSVCEYADAAAATEGAKMNDAAFAAIKNRKTYRNGGTTLTVLEVAKTPENDALVKKLVDAFEGLKPSAAH